MSSSLKFDIEPTLFHQVKRGFGDLVLILTTPPLPEVQVLGKFLRWLALLQFPVRKATLRAAWGCPEGGLSSFFYKKNEGVIRWWAADFCFGKFWQLYQDVGIAWIESKKIEMCVCFEFS